MLITIARPLDIIAIPASYAEYPIIFCKNIGRRNRLPNIPRLKTIDKKELADKFISFNTLILTAGFSAISSVTTKSIEAITDIIVKFTI